MYRSREALPQEYGRDAGHRIFLYYHFDNMAWALGQVVGSADVIGFVSDESVSPTKIFMPWVFENDHHEAGYRSAGPHQPKKKKMMMMMMMTMKWRRRKRRRRKKRRRKKR